MNTIMLVSLMSVLNVASGVGGGGGGLIIDTAAIIAGFFDGANIIFGLGGLLALIALPYGLQFALNLVGGLFGKLGSIRF